MVKHDLLDQPPRGSFVSLADDSSAKASAESEALAGESGPLASAPARRNSIAEIQPRGTRPPLYFVHGVGGGMSWGYANLARHLGPDQPVCWFRSRDLDGLGEGPSIEEMAARYVADLRAFQPHGPYLIGGYCFGGNVAYEMALQLAAAGEEPALLALFNCAPPNTDYETRRFHWSPRWQVKFYGNSAYWLACFLTRWKPAERKEFIRWKLRVCREKLGAIFQLAEMARCDADELVALGRYSDSERRLWAAHARALLRYRPKPYSGHITLFRTRAHPLFCSFDKLCGWGQLAEHGVTAIIVPGQHSSILQEPHVQKAAGKLKRCLERIQQGDRATA